MRGPRVTLNEYNRFCRALAATTTVVQWEGAHVWKVGGKVFAIAHETEDHALHVTFKCSPMSYDMLREMPGCRPAPYLASRGMSWIQRTSAEALDDLGLKDYLRASYDLVIQGLPKRVQQELGFSTTANDVKSNAKAKARRKQTSAIASKQSTSPKPQSATIRKAAANPKAKPRAARATSRKGATS